MVPRVFPFRRQIDVATDSGDVFDGDVLGLEPGLHGGVTQVVHRHEIFEAIPHGQKKNRFGEVASHAPPGLDQAFVRLLN